MLHQVVVLKFALVIQYRKSKSRSNRSDNQRSGHHSLANTAALHIRRPYHGMVMQHDFPSDPER